MLLISGLICDYGLTLGDLKGVLEDFFSRLGATPKPSSFYMIFVDFAVKLIKTVLSGAQLFQEYLLSMPICKVFDKLASSGAL
jgi:hypothetical protein